MKFTQHLVEKPWGRTQLPPPFDSVAAQAGKAGARIGEVWFEPEDGRELPLLVKYIFTSEKLSVQVHPNDAEARERGERAGKNECWFIIDAEPDASLGLGTIKPMGSDDLRRAALDGSIEDLMDWKPVKPGEFYAVPAGTVHAIGAGVSLIEIQQNIDLTYRLYDYGRPRELHLADGVAVSKPVPYPEILKATVNGAVHQPLTQFPQFDVLHTKDVAAARANARDRAVWIVPLTGEVSGDGATAAVGGCLYLEPGMPVDAVSKGATALIGIAKTD